MYNLKLRLSQCSPWHEKGNQLHKESWEVKYRIMKNSETGSFSHWRTLLSRFYVLCESLETFLAVI